jgi:hypothetical protein
MNPERPHTKQKAWQLPCGTLAVRRYRLDITQDSIVPAPFRIGLSVRRIRKVVAIKRILRGAAGTS